MYLPSQNKEHCIVLYCIANLCNMHSQKFSAFCWVSVEKRDHESFQARVQDCHSVFEDDIFHWLSNPKARKKRDSFLACDSDFVRGVGGKNSTKKFPSIFQDTLGQLFKRSLASVWRNRVLSDFQWPNAFMLTPCFVNSFKKANGVD